MLKFNRILSWLPENMESFKYFEKIIDKLCETVNKLMNKTIKSIICRDWIDSITSSGISIIIVKNDVLFL